MPATLYIDDFDNNGRPDHLLAIYEGDKSLPLLLKRDLVGAMPVMDQQIESHAAYAGQSVVEIFSEEQIGKATARSVYQTTSVILLNDGTGGFTVKPLPPMAQQTPVYGVVARDFDQDGGIDLALAGNFSYVKPDLGRMYGAQGIFLKGGEGNEFEADQTYESGFFVPGDVRDMIGLTDVRFGEVLLIAVNNGPVRVLQVMGK